MLAVADPAVRAPIQNGTFGDIGWVVSHSYTLYVAARLDGRHGGRDGRPRPSPHTARPAGRCLGEHRNVSMLLRIGLVCTEYLQPKGGAET